jgi:ferredoxin, 2Fe-2S
MTEMTHVLTQDTDQTTTEITYILTDDSEQTVQASYGESVMRAALQNDVPGIIGECGGELSCGTCHVYVDAEWADKIDPQSEEERDLLDMMDDVRPESRLSCQIQLKPGCAGFRSRIAEQQ